MEAYVQKKMFMVALREGKIMLKAGARTVTNSGVLGLNHALAGQKEKARTIQNNQYAEISTIHYNA
ncbi:MAG: hypothetical protein K8R53_16170 [Bacteroidales bacterium]|nr:hypothetical protein [Bacteroidales bacterium]